MKKSQKGAQAFLEAQIYWGTKEKHLLTLVLTCFAYLIQLSRSLLENKPEIEYLYGSMPGIHDNIWARRPSLVNCELIQMIVTIMEIIVGSIILNW